MKKRIIGAIAATTVLAGSVALVAIHSTNRIKMLKGDTPSQIVLNSDDMVNSLDDGNLHQVDERNNKFDIIGYTAVSGKLGSIKKATYGSYHYNGMIYNRSVINGFTSMTVNFSGGTLYYVFTDFLMEDMEFSGHSTLTSGTSVSANNKAYFLIYNTSETPVTIDSIEINYACDASIDGEMIFNKNSTMGGARSYAKHTWLDDSFVTLENNPTKRNNNYSTGKTTDEDYDLNHDETWYRWNGRYFANSANLGTNFSFGMTVIGNISQMIDETKNFHYAVWPQFGWYDSEDVLHSTSNNYVQTYIGNDNYEPRGKDNALHPSDPYVNESYTGRFFSDYGWYDNTWKFPDPDTTTILDGVTTFREAYEAYNLPFWFIQFDVYLDEENDPACDVTINGFKLFTQWIFEDYDKVNTPGLIIHTMPMHLVNYGVDATGNPDSSYLGSFTYPRTIA